MLSDSWNIHNRMNRAWSVGQSVPRTVGCVELIDVELACSESVEHLAVEGEPVGLSHVVDHHTAICVHGRIHDAERWQRRVTEPIEQLCGCANPVGDTRPAQYLRQVQRVAKAEVIDLQLLTEAAQATAHAWYRGRALVDWREIAKWRREVIRK